MAIIISRPSQHDCHRELAELGKEPIGTVARCSCERRYVMRDDQRDGPYWSKVHVILL